MIYSLVQLVYECLALVTNFALLQKKKPHTFICTYMLLNVWRTKIAECQFGSYGKDCTGRCSVNCYITSRCNSVTGLCTDGCKAGWAGNTCDKRIFKNHFYQSRRFYIRMKLSLLIFIHTRIQNIFPGGSELKFIFKKA